MGLRYKIDRRMHNKIKWTHRTAPHTCLYNVTLSINSPTPCPYPERSRTRRNKWLLLVAQFKATPTNDIEMFFFFNFIYYNALHHSSEFNKIYSQIYKYSIKFFEWSHVL